MKSFLATAMFFLAATCFAQTDLDLAKLNDLSFKNVGPSRGGRVTTVAGVASRPDEFYMGATGGGVWKTTNFGTNWKNVSDGYFATGSIGAICVSLSDPDIVYVGTGSDGIRSNVIIGKGMYKSIDAGKTWKFIGLKEAGQIGAVEIHPQNPNICYVSAIGNPFGPNKERGVYKTTDGGANWAQVLVISENTGSCDLEICPGNPQIIYASAWTVRRKPWTIISGSEEGGVYKSIDGGSTWKKLANGLPVGIVGKSDLAVCLAAPQNLYVLIEAADGQGGLYFSEDYGEHFILLSDRSSLLDRPFYYCNIDVDPQNPDIIYSNATGFYKSTDKGKNWIRRSTPHGDNHDMWINPNDSDLYIQSNDGGANVTRDGGETWSVQSNQPTAELYQVNIDDQFPYWLYAGQQDNSTLAIPSTSRVSPQREAMNFIGVGGCETGPAVPKPGNHNIVYSNCKGRFGTFNKITGEEQQYYVGAQSLYGHNPKDLIYRFQRVSPIFVSPHNPDVVYHGSQYLHKTTNDGVLWETISPDLTANEPDKQVVSGSPITRDITGEEFYSTLYAISESPVQEGVIWTGANDGPVHVTRDGGKTWKNVTPPDLPPGGRVQTMEASPHHAGKAYFAVYRYLLDDWEPYIYATDDYGESWTRLTDGSNGIPINYPTRVVREDPDREGLLYVGTEFGLYISFDDGASWQSFQQNLPIVPVTDIKIHHKDLVLSTMGRSFWIMEDISVLHGINPATGKMKTTLFNPRQAYRSRATNGADFWYYLDAKKEKAVLRIMDESGKNVKSFKGSSSQGFHHLSWNLREDGESAGNERRGPSGPNVVPGKFKVYLLVGPETFEVQLEVLPDPRLMAQGFEFSSFKEQYDLSVKIQELVTKARSLSATIDTLWKPLHEKMNAGDKLNRKESKLYAALNQMHDAMITQQGPYPQPMLRDQIRYLFSMVNRVDQKPGKDAYIRFEELTRQLKEMEVRFSAIN